MLQAERKEIIKQKLQEQRSVSVNQLADEFDVTTETIRRDLSQLEHEGILIKTHGGAILRSRVMYSLSHSVLSTMYKDVKKALAYEASRFINPNDCIFLDWSTTVYELCDFIKDTPLTVISNSLDVLNFFADNNRVVTICPGGQFDITDHAFEGIETISFLKSHHFDKAFLSPRSIRLDSGLYDSNELMAELRRTVIENATNTTLLIDHTKIGRSSYAQICSFDKIHTLIIDDELPSEQKEMLARYNMQLIEVSTSGSRYPEEPQNLSNI